MYWPVLGQIQFCSFDRRCKTCLDTKPALCLLLNRLCACAKPTAPKPALCLLLNRLCIGTKPAFSFWINISTVSEVRFDCQGLGLVARNEASILVFDTKPVLYRPVLDQIQFCSFDRRCKTCLDTKPVLDQGRFCSLTVVRNRWDVLRSLLWRISISIMLRQLCVDYTRICRHNGETCSPLISTRLSGFIVR